MPDDAEAFRAELLRRLELLDRDVRALESGESSDSFARAGEPLGKTRKRLIELLFRPTAPETWFEAREELVDLWSRYRMEFEELAGTWQRRHSVPTGQSKRGPRW